MKEYHCFVFQPIASLVPPLTILCQCSDKLESCLQKQGGVGEHWQKQKAGIVSLQSLKIVMELLKKQTPCSIEGSASLVSKEAVMFNRLEFISPSGPHLLNSGLLFCVRYRSMCMDCCRAGTRFRSPPAKC